MVHLFGEDTGVMEAALATYGGRGWQARSGSHRSDVVAGQIWRACTNSSETGRLTDVLLAYPGPWVTRPGEANDALFIAWPDVSRMRSQAEALARFYEAQGVTVHWMRPADAPPNVVFLRDLLFMTPEGAVLARPGSVQRASEPPLVMRALADLAIPILGMPRAHAVFEGADALWLDQKTVLIGIGNRTNREGAAYLSALLNAMGVETISIPLPAGVQHLLGVVNFVSRNIAIVRGDKIVDELMDTLRSRGIATIACPCRTEIFEQFGMNFVALAPNRVVMPAGFPAVHRMLRDIGVEVHEIDVGEYCKAGGGIGCLTGILARDALEP